MGQNADRTTDWQMHEAVAAIAATGVSPIVRIAANEGWMVKRMPALFFYIKRLQPLLNSSRCAGRWCSRDCCATSIYSR